MTRVFAPVVSIALAGTFPSFETLRPARCNGLRRLISHAQTTPTAASMKDHMFVGADCQVGSVACKDCGRVDMRRVVMMQIKKPMLKIMPRPMRLPRDICRR